MTAAIAMLGNQNARKGREWSDALRKARMQFEDLPNDIKRGMSAIDIIELIFITTWGWLMLAPLWRKP